MEQQKAAPTLVYFHIPKCAGSTMMSLLRANYGDGFHRVGNGGGWRKFPKRPAKQRARITCLTGHMPWGVQITGNIRIPYQTATMLRNPVDRVTSLYWFVKRFKKHKWHPWVRNKNLCDFALSTTFADIDNGMVRWLAGCRDCGALRLETRVTEDHLKLAMTHLAAMPVVGFVESFDASVQCFAKAFSWQRTNYKRKMISKPYRKANKQEHLVIAEANRFDMALYEYALRTK